MIDSIRPERQAVNLQISAELKQALREISRRNRRTMAETIRLALQTALPLLNAFWEAENRLLDDWSARQSRRRRKSGGRLKPISSRDGDPGGRGN